MHNAPLIQRIAIIGFGEVGGIFGNDFSRQGIEVSVFDILLASRQHRQHILSKSQRCQVRAADTLSDCIREAELVISAVTAASALDVARDAGRLLSRGQIFLDINSVSPGSKRVAASYFKQNQAYFVEAAVMEAVPRQRLRVPMLLGGSHAREVVGPLRSLGMNATPLSDQVGIASAVKMCRSVMIKGLEALAVECLFAARQYGAEEMVLESLASSYPSLGWKDHLPDYLISRVAEHGRRRAAELREVARALKDVGIEPTMALATARRQEWLVSTMADREIGCGEDKSFSWRTLADAIMGCDKRGSRLLRNKS